MEVVPSGSLVTQELLPFPQTQINQKITELDPRNRNLFPCLFCLTRVSFVHDFLPGVEIYVTIEILQNS